jgi:ribose transport system ATP-binding protein
MGGEITSTDAVVTMRDMRKRFGGVVALDGAGFELRAGEVHALAGENGAGKSTLMKILQGAYRADSGEVLVHGRPLEQEGPLAARDAGIGMVFQEFSLIPTLSVAQNVFLTIEPLTRGGTIDDRRIAQRTAEIFASIGVQLDPNASLRRLGTAYWQLTEIAKAIAQNASILIMDEPTASLARHESEALFELIERLKARGISIVYTSHRMDEVFSIADRITVLRNGKDVLTAEIEASSPAAVIEAMLGRGVERELEHLQGARERDPAAPAAPLLQVDGLTGGRLRGTTFTLHAGEVLGIVGLMGSGRTELTRALFGIDRPESGTIAIDGEPTLLRSPADAIERGVVLVPEDRRAQGLVLSHSVEDNLMLPLLDRVGSRGVLRRAKIKERTRELISKLSIKGLASAAVPVQKLSGGNQQKVVIAKWLGTEPNIVLLDEPTAGIDVGTKAEILKMVRDLAEAGRGVVFISSELSEVLAVSDRILIMRDGAIVRELPRTDVGDDKALQLLIQEQ